MRLSSIAIIAGSFAAAGAVSLVSAYYSVQVIETASRSGVLNALDREGLTWAEVDTNGLQVFLIGTAPDEATRFQALSVAGGVVDAARLIDQMLIEEPEDIAPPRFSIEILRNDAGLSVIGLLPASTDRAELVERFRALAGDGEYSDFLETADFPAPEGWDAALRFAMGSLSDLPRSKVSVDAERVAIKAMTESEEAKRRLETTLSRRAPEGLRLAVDVSAPRPVISPFTLRFTIDADGPHFDSCSADSEEARDRIFGAAAEVGLAAKATCTLGLGVPSRRWADAAELAIAKLGELGAGTVTFTNADVQLLAPEGTDPVLFARIASEIEAGLPEVFALEAVLPKTPDASAGPAEFSATLSPEGEVQIRGRIGSEISRQTADSLARARFGSGAVYTAARVDETLPQNWGVRALAGLEVLSILASGTVVVTLDEMRITGKTGRQDARAAITALLGEKLGEGAAFTIDVTYDKQLDESLGLPSPQECETQIVEIIGDRKLTFEPGSATLDASAKDILDDVAVLLKKCGDIPLEIGGHTDSQGRESMNQQLSRDRAQAVFDALRIRLVPVGSYSVKGYGEVEPVATNDTEEGREANRRIAFKLLRDADGTADGDGNGAEDGDGDGDGDEASGAEDAAAEGTGNEQN